jgi:predicted molibdopterin-dependent oxidoreductase YjgC
VLALAERARFVLTSSMYMTQVTGWSHLVLPGTSYLEREGTTVNLEGRPQRLRAAVAPPAFGELEFFARLCQRFGLEGHPGGRVSADERATLPPRTDAALADVPPPSSPRQASEDGFALLRYRTLFSGPAVERVRQLQFQRPAPEIELAHADAIERGIAAGDTVAVSSNGTSRELRSRLNRRLRRGVVRIAAEHAEGLGDVVTILRMSQ